MSTNSNLIAGGQPRRKAEPSDTVYAERGGKRSSEEWVLHKAGLIDQQHALLASAEVFITTSPPTSFLALPRKFRAANWT